MYIKVQVGQCFPQVFKCGDGRMLFCPVHRIRDKMCIRDRCRNSQRKRQPENLTGRLYWLVIPPISSARWWSCLLYTSGYTAAIYAARANLNPLLYSGMLPGGLLTQTTEVENFPGFPESVLGFDLVTAMQAQAERFGTRIEYDAVEKFELTDGGIQKLILPSGDVVETEALIIATGASPVSYTHLDVYKRQP